MRLPLLRSFQGYGRDQIGPDLLAGLTVWAVLVPEALAYATIAGVSPVVGLYAAPPALVLYAVFGSSRHLVVGPMSATAALSATAVADVASGTDDFAALTATLAIMTGVLALAAGLARLGFFSNFISEPVLKGFIIGMALTIIVGQLPKLVGEEGSEGDFFERLWAFVSNLDDAHGPTALVGLGTLALVLGLKRYLPVVPASLVAVALGVLAVTLLGLADRGVAIVGDIDSGLPSFGAPDVTARDYGMLASGAVGVMLVGFAEGLGAAKAYATKAHYEIDANRELIGLGAANAATGLSSGMVVNGSLSKTAVNGGAGARSQVSGLVVAGLTVVTLLVLTGLFEDLPDATLPAPTPPDVRPATSLDFASTIETVDFASAVDVITSVRIRGIEGRGLETHDVEADAARFEAMVDTLHRLVLGYIATRLELTPEEHAYVLTAYAEESQSAVVDYAPFLAARPPATVPASNGAPLVTYASFDAVNDFVGVTPQTIGDSNYGGGSWLNCSALAWTYWSKLSMSLTSSSQPWG